MLIECFLDTNVLLYAARGRQDERDKQKIASKLLDETSFGLSGQVLAEFVSNALQPKKHGVPLSAPDIQRWLVGFEAYPIQPVDAGIVSRGLEISQRYQITYCDAAIIAAAERLGAPVLYTEDLNHGQSYGPVKVINPFRPT
jgi:predicted nucleic acid-binding protein